MTVWSTDAVAPGDGFSFWHDAVCQAVLNVSTECPPSGPFRARIAGRQYGSLRCATFQSSSHAIVRTPSHLTSSTDDGYLVSLQLKGEGHIEQGEQRFVLKAGEIAILDGARPFRVGFPRPVERLVAVLPRRMLESRLPWIRRARGCRLSGNAPMTALAREHLILLAQADAHLNAADGALLGENLCNLLAIATAPGQAPNRSDASAESLIALGRHHLDDPELSPQKLAALAGISLRTLHSRFQLLGRPWSRWLVESRLERCEAQLRNPACRERSVSQIAYDCGFNDLSHFNRSFRTVYGTTPTAWRKRRDI